MIIVALASLFVPKNSYATGKYNIGFNEEWVSGYLQYLGENCPDCPTNSVSANLSSITSLLYDLATNQHVGAFREIIPLELLQNAAAKNSYTDVISVISIYSTYNLFLTISVGLPIPASVSVTGSNFNIMPTDANDWNTLSYFLSTDTAAFINALWNSPYISRQWMMSRLFVEPFNEFDGLLNINGSTISSSPARAVALENDLAYFLYADGISTNMLMPSVVGNYSGYSPGVDSRVQYISDYYALGGAGLPNVHIYAPVISPATTYSEVVSAISAEVQSIANVIPSSMIGHVLLGETGNADATPPYCAPPNGTTYGPSIDPSQRANEYAAIAQDPTINTVVGQLNFWRLMEFSPQQTYSPSNPVLGCEAYYGVVPYMGSYYNSVGLNLFYYLNH
jgi:hypothetical protein